MASWSASHPPLRGTFSPQSGEKDLIRESLAPRSGERVAEGRVRDRASLTPAGERIHRFPGSVLRRPHGLLDAVLNLLDQHLVLVLIRIAGVVGESHFTHQAVPLAVLEHALDASAVALRLRRRL